ncbi:MAG: lysine--tRNA ligase, partial [Candidatus Spechtbacterales bacterium]
MALDDIIAHRLHKRKQLQDLGDNPYPVFVKRTHTATEVRDNFERLEKEGTPVTLVGRLMSLREHGGLTFGDLKDGTGSFQLAFREDSMGKEGYREIEKFLDLGDFISADGMLFTTKRGEKSVDVSSFDIIAKAMRPLPEKWHGLKNVEERYRKRYLDLLMSEEVKNIFVTRSTIIKATREFLDAHGFVEVETSILQPIPGGASARPFKTHLDALDMDLYLRVAPELDLKKLLVGGFEKVYEIGRNFRNEGIDLSHNPEFTSLEFYWAYTDYKELMKFSEQLFQHIFEAVGKYPKFEHEGKEIDLTTPWPRIEFTELLHKYAGIAYEDVNRDGLAKEAQKHGIHVEAHLNKGQIADLIYKKLCRPNVVEPTFVIHQPTELAPLAKSLPENPEYDARFQLIINGWEMVNAFSEMNDPVLQRELFMAQEEQLRCGDEEAQRLDESFLDALEHGMPPAAGFAFGVDRLTALLTNAHALREV